MKTLLSVLILTSFNSFALEPMSSDFEMTQQNEKGNGGLFSIAQVEDEIRFLRILILDDLHSNIEKLPNELSMELAKVRQLMEAKDNFEATNQDLFEESSEEKVDAINNGVDFIRYNTGAWGTLDRCHRKLLVLHENLSLAQIEESMDTHVTDQVSSIIKECKEVKSQRGYEKVLKLIQASGLYKAFDNVFNMRKREMMAAREIYDFVQVYTNAKWEGEFETLGDALRAIGKCSPYHSGSEEKLARVLNSTFRFDVEEGL